MTEQRSLADLIAANAPTFKPAFDVWVDALPERDRAALIAAARDEAWSNAALRAQVNAARSTVGKDAFATWRRRVLAS